MPNRATINKGTIKGAINLPARTKSVNPVLTRLKVVCGFLITSSSGRPINTNSAIKFPIVCSKVASTLFLSLYGAYSTPE